MNKKQSQQAHARKRAASRFGINHGPDSEQDIIQQILEQKAIFVRKESLRIKIWLVTLKDGSKAKVVYDKQNKVIVSFLPTSQKEIEDIIKSNTNPKTNITIT